MKQIKIRSILTNSENETTNIEALGTYDETTSEINYKEEELNVNIKISKEKIILKRENDDYNLNLEFKLNEKIKTKHEVKSVGLDIELIVYTKKLEIKENYIYIEYELYNNELEMGIFEYKLIFWE